MSRDHPHRCDEWIALALTTQGGHLHIGRGGGTLHYRNARLSGFNCEPVKAAAIAAGLPVIDSRCAPLDLVAKLSINGPMIAVNEPASPRPWNAFSYAPLAAVAAAYRKAGADVRNIPRCDEHEAILDARPPGPVGDLIDFWLDHIRGTLVKEPYDE